MRPGLSVGDSLNGRRIAKTEMVGEKVVYTPVMVRDGVYLANGVVNHNCSFEGSSPTLVDGEVMKTFSPADPILVKYCFSMNVYEEPKPGFKYAMGADSSTGVGQDYCAFQILKVLDKDHYEQVCVYKNNKIKPVEYAKVIAETSTAYNNAALVIENNDCGKYVAEELWYNIGCQNIINTDKKGIGTRATPASKLSACLALKKIADSHRLVLHDAETIYQLSRFEQTSPNHFKGAKNCHDDLVTGLYWAAYCLVQPQFGLEDIQTEFLTKEPEEHDPQFCLFDGMDDNSDFWRSFN